MYTTIRHELSLKEGTALYSGRPMPSLWVRALSNPPLTARHTTNINNNIRAFCIEMLSLI